MAITEPEFTKPEAGYPYIRRFWRDLNDPSRSIHSPCFDALVFIGSPVLCLLVSLLLALTPLWEIQALPFHEDDAILNTFSGVFTASHLFAVFFRSHGNSDVFRRWPLRFTLVPVVLFFALGILPWFAVVMSVTATFWDVYHSSMQTFGLGRIYDMKVGNAPDKGRLLDSWINLVFYAGPIAAGAALMDHVEDFGEFKEIGWAALAAFPQTVEGLAGILRTVVISGSLIMVAVYVVGYWRLSKQGYQISAQKVMLLASTALTSIIAWGFNPFFIAFVVMNAFHAIQYFAIVWLKEGKSLTKRMGLSGSRHKKWLPFALFLIPSIIYGVVQEYVEVPGNWLFAFILTVVLLHFWYDGFIWSVRKKHV
jgi:hypothetical protein